MKCASIDIGTNTLRLLIAEPRDDGVGPLVYERSITRLGGGYTDEAGLDPASVERTIKALEGFKHAIDEHGAGVENVFAAATSVVRRAVNRDRFIEEAFRRTGIRIRVIDGAEEAELTLLGVLSVIGIGGGIGGSSVGENRFVVDIGGGSTEFILTAGSLLVGSWSMELGVVHLTETHLVSDPPTPEELLKMEREVGGVIETLEERIETEFPDQCGLSDSTVFVGTAGTITTLAALDLDLTVYDPALINNHELTRAAVESMYRRLKSMTLAEREGILTLEKGREDLIIPGAAIVLNVMDRFGFDTLRVSDAGLLEGLILSECESGPAGPCTIQN